MIQCFQMKTATVSDTKVSFNAPQSVTHPAERTFNLVRQRKSHISHFVPNGWAVAVTRPGRRGHSGPRLHCITAAYRFSGADYLNDPGCVKTPSML